MIINTSIDIDSLFNVLSSSGTLGSNVSYPLSTSNEKGNDAHFVSLK